MWKYKVTFMVSCDLSYPELRACLWDDELAAAFVSVPETPVHEDAGPVLGQDYARRVPGRVRTHLRKRYPRRCCSRLAACSGRVSSECMLAIHSWRCWGVRCSDILKRSEPFPSLNLLFVLGKSHFAYYGYDD